MLRRSVYTRCSLLLISLGTLACSNTDDDQGDTPSTANGAQSSALEVALDDGPLVGAAAANGVRSFLGIPYAEPPVGALRFQPPQAPKKWSALREAKAFGGRCAQIESTVLQNAGSEDEDCLYLNVWTPAAKADAKLPVMVWIHGGGNVNGSASEPVPYIKTGVFYSGEHLANKGVVVVSLNYRLGVFGFLAHPELQSEGGSTGNQGMWDQRFALQWVQRNIARFGGDPQQVTIFGESAGALDVCAHVVSPESRGLFQRAISQSGACTTLQRSAQDGAQQTATLAQKLGCGEGAVLSCLREHSVSELLAASEGLTFGLVVDGKFWPDQPRALYERGEIAKVPYILGSNTDEGTLFTTGAKIDSEAALAAAVKQTFSAAADQVLARYPLSKFASEGNPAAAAFARIVGDARLVCPTVDAAVRHADAGASTYMYNFDIPANMGGLGATHGAELVYVFGTGPSLDAAQRTASERIQDYWVNLAKSGDPNASNLLPWPAFSTGQDVRLNFALETAEVRDFRAEECAFWRGVYALAFTTQTK